MNDLASAPQGKPNGQGEQVNVDPPVHVAAATAPPGIEVNPPELAEVLLMLLHRRVKIRPSERVAFDRCEALLHAIRTGALVVTYAPRKPPERT